MTEQVTITVLGSEKAAVVCFGDAEGKTEIAINSIELSRSDLLALSHVFHAIATSPNYVRDERGLGFDRPDQLSINVEAVFKRGRRLKKPPFEKPARNLGA